MKPDTPPNIPQISSVLCNAIHTQLLNNPHTIAFTFVVNAETQTAEIISTSKFTTLLNQELIKNFIQIATANVEEPQTPKDAVDKFRVYKIPLPPPSNEHPQGQGIPSVKMEEERPFTPSRRMTPITRSSPRMSPATPNPNYAQLEPELVLPKPPQCTSPRRNKRTPTPHKQCFHQTIDTTIDDSTKQKLINVLGKNPGDEWKEPK
ncbi:hypothetical protein EIN_087150 [Entamoeba invadens IP1]|uniref:Uncharacterized protein n=1 Tax=Entamoeba invadens TaxID=33085 RepID=S0B717_ENTIV|nr:hypothetical protein EIN_087150 [Entamoeba invadens IP1]ELP85413.1 hypothetical protein EIN_087150 [Entamoeba invadens IP1]BAN41727.1 hypothetical protein [Entamoeba invadens]|eukprot:XP_004184759.1 hypothetical protein EIN_087150 [Entamoeba invadens IP1]